MLQGQGPVQGIYPEFLVLLLCCFLCSYRFDSQEADSSLGNTMRTALSPLLSTAEESLPWLSDSPVKEKQKLHMVVHPRNPSTGQAGTRGPP